GTIGSRLRPFLGVASAGVARLVQAKEHTPHGLEPTRILVDLVEIEKRIAQVAPSPLPRLVETAVVTHPARNRGRRDPLRLVAMALVLRHPIEKDLELERQRRLIRPRPTFDVPFSILLGPRPLVAEPA